eukprot:1662573-Pleurochrysis_carterae.AAC.4
MYGSEGTKAKAKAQQCCPREIARGHARVHIFRQGTQRTLACSKHLPCSQLPPSCQEAAGLNLSKRGERGWHALGEGAQARTPASSPLLLGDTSKGGKAAIATHGPLLTPRSEASS